LTQIKIIDAPVVDGSTDKIVMRLRRFRIRIRATNVRDEDGLLENDAEEEVDELSYRDQKRIVERSTKLLKARLAAAGLSHLKKEEYARLEPSLAGMRIVMAKGVDWADEVAASLHDEMPWMGPATEYLWHSLRLSAQKGEALTIRPVILNGPPGIGKSVWARTTARSLSLPSVDIDLSPKFPPALHGVLGVKSLALGCHLVHRFSLQKFHRRQVAQC
jgi:SpoVK/Ycf46/Vps4 family AAA+-type ATPase